jgi:hypothetical protein
MGAGSPPAPNLFLGSALSTIRYLDQQAFAYWPWRDRQRMRRISRPHAAFYRYKERNHFARPKHRCRKCRKPLRPGLMLFDNVWKSLTKDWRAYWCDRCIRRKLGRPITHWMVSRCQWNENLLDKWGYFTLIDTLTGDAK